MGHRAASTTPARMNCLRRAALGGLLLALVLAFGSGCATYSDRMEKARVAVTAGDYASGIAEVDGIIDVDEPTQIPDDLGDDAALGLLERATLKQATYVFPGSARDFEAADKGLELLDIANDTAGDIGKYVFSDSSTKYRTSPVEKISLNGFNMMNYLADGNLQGARVEAKRFTVMQNYLTDFDPKKPHAAFGSYLAGFTMERLGEYNSAMRYYDEALQERHFDSLREPVARLAHLTGYRGKRIAGFLATGPAAASPRADDAELLVVVSVGRVPHKVPERMPIGMAVGIAGSWISGNPAVLGHSAMKFVVYPELVPSESLIAETSVSVDGRTAPLELASNLGIEITREYEAIKPRIIGAAISRMIVRAAAAEGMRQAGNQQSEGLGWVLALFTEAAMVAMDKPDTRSWIFLPDRVYIHRSRIRPGKHEITVQLGGTATRAETVEVEEGGFAAVVVTAPR